MQQAYEAAQAALDARKAGEARRGFDALLQRMPPGARTRSAMIVKARLAAALVMDQAPEAAVPLLDEVIPFFDKPTPADREERAMALHDRARAAEIMGRFGAAASDLRAVQALQVYPADGPLDVGLRAMLVRVLLWTDPVEARRLANGLLAMRQGFDSKSMTQLAYLQSLRGRVDLVDGRPAEALGWFQKAGRAAGGTSTTRVSVADVRVRSDLAIAHHLAGNREEHQRAVAFSGAGMLVSEGFNIAATTPLPPCAPVTGLDPQDVAVIEFAIGDDGRVRGATPVYARRADGKRSLDDAGPESLFTQAVRRWAWNETDVGKLDGFWRQSVRVELRCLTDREGDAIIDSFDPQIEALRTAWGLEPFSWSSNLAQDLRRAREALKRDEATLGPTARQLLVPLSAISDNPTAPVEERMAARRRQIELLGRHGAPADLVMLDRARLATAEVRARDIQDRGARQAAYVAALAPLLAEEEAARPTSRTAHYLRLELAERAETRVATDRARAYLERIVATPEAELGKADPIRTAALLRLSNLSAATGDAAGAAQALAATGLTPEQCALVDVRPMPLNQRVTAETFPKEAARWGSSGFARLAYDLTPAGVPTNIRTVIAAPPFVFGPASEAAQARFRYKPVFRPENSLGCVNSTQMFRFKAGP